MTEQQMMEITALKKSGLGYRKIAQRLGISADTMKSFFRRCDTGTCPVCGRDLHKRQRFCSDTCRIKWWNAHPGEIKQSIDITCKHCHKVFTTYKSSTRKYCCHECYIADRFGCEQHGGEQHGGEQHE